jgi:tetratricopeptide (TPR) repeat protein
MTRKRNKSNKQPRPSKEFRISTTSLKFIKEVLTLIGGLAGSILAVYGLIRTFKDDAEGFSWLIPVGVVVWIIILWRLFQARKTTAYSLFIISVLIGVIGWISWQSQVEAAQKKLTVLVAKFEGPEAEYGLRDQIMEELRQLTKSYPNTIIIDGKEVINAGSGSEHARKLGEEANADLVIWAWYRPTENPNITIHVENLSVNELSIIEESQIYQPIATIKDLETFEFQKTIGREARELITLLMGYVSAQSGDCETALPIFDKIIADSKINNFVRKRDVLYLSAGCNFTRRKFNAAIDRYDEIILENNDDFEVYLSRGSAYFNIGKNENAFADFNKAVDLDPYSVDAYLKRATYFSLIEDDEHALEDINKAIEFAPNDYKVYLGLSNIYNNSGQYDLALQALDKASQIDSNHAVIFNNMGGIHNNLGQYELALKDYNRAIKLEPETAFAYNNRGFSYEILGNYKQALNDYTKAIQLDPFYPTPYHNRSSLYRKIGEWGKAEADFKKYEELTGEEP